MKNVFIVLFYLRIIILCFYNIIIGSSYLIDTVTTILLIKNFIPKN